MRTYEFGGVKKTLKRNTFELEEQAKEIQYVNAENGKKLLSIKNEFEKLQDELISNPSEERREYLDKKMFEMSVEVANLNKMMEDVNSFESWMKVLDILFVEGSSELTKHNIGKFDAQQVLQDFFTLPQVSNRN